jgi:nitronate monooxygenase
MNPSNLSTPLLTRLGISVPVIQAPMAGTSTPALAAAVSNAGGLGSLGMGATTVEGARAMIRETRALTRKPFNVNLFVHAPATADAEREARWLAYLAPEFARFSAEPPAALREIYKSSVDDDAMLAMLVEERPAVVSFHFGLPKPHIVKGLHDAGIVLLASATSLDEATQIERAGIDAIVAQGIEAGGHRGVFDPRQPDEGLGTLALVRVLVRHTHLPVIAAGGIMDGAGIAAVLALGAQAAQLGTAFVASPESAADAAYRAVIANPAVRTTLITSISGRPARGVDNRLAELGRAPDRPPFPDYPIAYDVGKALHAAAKAQGNYDYAPHWAGQAVRLSRAMPAAELVATLMREVAQAGS